MADSITRIPVDDKGRPIAESMTDSDKLTEILVLMRGVQDAIEAISANPAVAMMLGQ